MDIKSIRELLITIYCSVILFIRSWFLKDRPIFIIIVNLLYPLVTLIVPTTDVAFDAFIQMRILLSIGIYFLTVDSIGSMISLKQRNKEMPYLDSFFEARHEKGLKGAYLAAGWSALIVGKTPMTATGRAAMAAAFISGGVFLYNGYLQRAHENSQAARQRAHAASQAQADRDAHAAQAQAAREAHAAQAQAARDATAAQAVADRAMAAQQAAIARAYQNYQDAKKTYDNSYFKQGPKPVWSEDNYTAWTKY